MRAALLLVCGLLSACESSSWVWQAARGQWQLQRLAVPVEEVLENPATTSELRQRLELVLSLADFAVERLGLEDSAYRHYVELDRPYVVWNVFATPEFSLEARRWCYPIAGCVSYRGYFSEQDARSYAVRLAEGGQDTWVGGVAAYSTLGWLQDPILSTWLWREETALAALLFHELSHRRVYVAGDTTFSESLASLLEEQLLREWLQGSGAGQQFDTYQRRTATRASFAALVACTWSRLDQLYARDLSEALMRQRKDEVLADLREAYARWSPQWPDPGAFDSWMAAELNNARLLTVISYRRWVPALRELLRQLDDDLSAFLLRMDEFASLSEAERERRLGELAPVTEREEVDCGGSGRLL